MDLESRFKQAEQYLKFLTQDDNENEEGRVTFQIFDDTKRTTTARHFSGSLEEHFGRLNTLNKNGMGIFVMINEGDCKGRSMQNIKRIRAIPLDLDGAPVQPIYECPIAPQILVETSPGRFQALWIVKDCSIQQFVPIAKAIATKFSGDQSICDLARVMRLPGFFHMKNIPFLCSLREI